MFVILKFVIMNRVALFFACLIVILSVSHGKKLDGRIVGGKDVSIKDFPYQLSLRLVGIHICGASIISKDWALTAAHCVDVNKRLYSALTLNAGTSFVEMTGAEYKLEQIEMHASYDNETSDYDIAVLKVSPPFDLTAPAQKAIGLPALNEEVPVGTLGTVSGWGVTDNGEDSAHLKAVQIPLIPWEECSSVYPGEVTDRMICFAVMKGGKDSCQGDSGGPMVVAGKQVGVVSWGHGCAMRNMPGVYSNVAYFRDWITQKTGL